MQINVKIQVNLIRIFPGTLQRRIVYYYITEKSNNYILDGEKLWILSFA